MVISYSGDGLDPTSILNSRIWVIFIADFTPVFHWLELCFYNSFSFLALEKGVYHFPSLMPKILLWAVVYKFPMFSLKSFLALKLVSKRILFEVQLFQCFVELPQLLSAVNYEVNV